MLHVPIIVRRLLLQGKSQLHCNKQEIQNKKTAMLHMMENKSATTYCMSSAIESVAYR
jgi:hypothetical protein